MNNQKNLMINSIEKIEEYSEHDSRIIPFAHTILYPIFRVIGKRNEQLDDEEAKSIYTNIVDSLFMLDRDLRIESSIDNIIEVINKYGVQVLVSHDAIPLPLFASLEKITESSEIKRKLIDICSDTEFVQGRELQRKIFRGFASLEEHADNDRILEHISRKATGSKGLGSMLGAVSLVAHDSEFKYPFDLQDENSILRNLRLQLTDKSIKRLGLNDITLEKYIERLETDERFERIGKIVTTLAGYSHYQTQRQQLELLKEIISNELNGNFLEWRYSHELANEQLAVLDEKKESWKKNMRTSRLVGELDALKAHIDSIKNVSPTLMEIYREQYGDIQKEELINKVKENEELLRSEELSNKDRKELGYRASLLREQLAYIEIINGLQELSTDNYQLILDKAEKIARKQSKNPLYHNAVWIRETLDQPVYRNARRISVIETDDLEDLLRIGEIPIPHCQNWKYNSTYNESLLSLVADSNKKLYHIANGNDKPIGMSLVRLLDWENDPTLLLENIYSNEWSSDYGIALIGSLADKAASINDEVVKPIRLAAPHYSGHHAHNTNIQVNDALEKFSEQFNVQTHNGTIDINLPKSKSISEYVDCGPGKIKSGSGIKIDVQYIIFRE